MPQLTNTQGSQVTPIQVVESLFEAINANDLPRALSLLSDEIEYQNVPFPAERGKAAVERTLRVFSRIADQLEIKVHNIAERGNIVLTERTDTGRGRFVEFEFWMCGTFEVRNGKIVLWRDRFDVGGFVLALLGGPVRRLLRGLRTTEQKVSASSDPKQTASA